MIVWISRLLTIALVGFIIMAAFLIAFGLTLQGAAG